VRRHQRRPRRFCAAQQGIRILLMILDDIPIRQTRRPFHVTRDGDANVWQPWLQVSPISKSPSGYRAISNFVDGVSWRRNYYADPGITGGQTEDPMMMDEMRDRYRVGGEVLQVGTWWKMPTPARGAHTGVPGPDRTPLKAEKRQGANTYDETISAPAFPLVCLLLVCLLPSLQSALSPRHRHAPGLPEPPRP
jgi:hypothetical protein